MFRGQTFASIAERDFAENLYHRNIPWEYESEKLKWVPAVRTYTPDFKVRRRDGSEFLIEYKGYLRSADRTKMKAIRKQYPKLDIRFVFMNASTPIYKGSNTTNGMWATQHGFMWAERVLPKEWLKKVRKKQRYVNAQYKKKKKGNNNNDSRNN